MLRGFGFDSLLGKASAHNAADNCNCGCVPNILSLHDAAKERARRRAEAAEKKPTVAEMLAKRQEALQAAAAANAAVTSALFTPGECQPADSAR
jgi:hypothetical protein